VSSAGCGDDAAVDSSNKTVDAGNNTENDIAEKDTGSSTTTDTATATDTGTSADAGKAGDTSIQPTCPGNPGCSCGSDDECYSDHCIEVGGAKVCARLCADGCKDNEACVKKGNDQVCVPKWSEVCKPCKANSECQGQGLDKNRCVDRGADGFFCGTVCTKSDECPTGYVCEDLVDVEGAKTRQCVLPANKVCSCSDAAMKVEATTSCKAKHSNGGFCLGERTCLAKGAPGAPTNGGLTACKAPEPATETCDGIDNDCDGVSDEQTCDDNNPCTADSCGGAAGCTYLGDSGKPCDADGSVCTQNDTCKDGKCQPGKAKVCDDNNPCTADSCDPKTGCTTKPEDGSGCNADDNPCTVNDTCKNGQCGAGPKKACESGDDCIQGKCDLTSGACKYTAKAGVPCNDGNPCTNNESCAGEVCKGKLINCDDKSPCTSDSCNPVKGCQHDKTAGPCSDDDKCTEKDACKDGKCVGLAIGVTKACDDDNACTQDSCKSQSGCFHKKLDGTTCSDGNTCTEKDTCKIGKCQAGANACGCTTDADCKTKEDGNLCNGTLHCDASSKTCKIKPGSKVSCDTTVNNACRANACNPKTGVCAITNTTDGTSCDADGSVCTKNDTCKAGKCRPGSPAKCDDNNDCTSDVCDAKKGCTYKANNDPCDADGSKCTQADRCKGGACVAGKAKACDDSEDCTKDVCRASDAVCLYQPLTNTCDDGNKCTLGEKCGQHQVTLAWTCVAQKNLTCNDGNPCTVDKCDANKGCVAQAVPDGAACSDGNKCTTGDTCAGGKCSGKAVAPKLHCNDFNACTDDVCSPSQGCLNKPAGAKTCDDGDKCTTGDKCAAGKCIGGANTCGCATDKDCADKEDGNKCNGTLFCNKTTNKCAINPATVVSCDTSLNTVCQTNGCDPKAGKCVVTKKKDGTPCNADNNVCTGKDACASGTCVPGKLLDCNDNNPCTSDSCDPKGGCVNTPTAGTCDDGDKCTQLDTCQGGGCKGKPLDIKTACDDGNNCTTDSCDKGKGCQNKALADGKKCDDSNDCTVSDQCKSGKCAGGTNVCACKVDADCKSKEDGNACNGTLFCDTSGGVSQCKINPTTIVKCNTSTDNFCKKTACNPNTGKCEADVKSDKTPCNADNSVCSTSDACKSGKCLAGPLLPCDDKSPCTVDSCDPKKGCVHTAKSGPCDADGNACTVNDTCAAGKCAVGKKKDCSDGTTCTEDTCDKTSGKCGYKNIVTSCSDGSACTLGDKCGTDKAGKYTCIPGKIADCDDSNPCTVDACDKVKGCGNTIDTALTAPCWSGDPKQRSVGECKDGKQRCQSDGSLGKCLGSKLPANIEPCDAKDNDCDGTTDEGCAPTAFEARVGNAVLEGKGKKFGVRATVAVSGVGGVSKTTGKYGAGFGWYQWLRSWLK